MTRPLAAPAPRLGPLAGRGLLALLALGSLLCAAQQKRKPSKLPEIEVVQVSAQRSQGLVVIDGKVRNCGERNVRGLTLVFDMIAPGREVVTRHKGAIDDEVLEPGGEAEFHWQMRDPVRAVNFRIYALDSSGNDLPVKNAGPYPVE